MAQVSMIMITMPLCMPLVEAMGFNIVWFGVLALLMMEISLATPPFGLLLFVAKGAAPTHTTMGQIIVSVLPFIGISLLVVALIIAAPSITTVLPALLTG